jgi:pyridoxal phosphate enzyme (YggS family)
MGRVQSLAENVKSVREHVAAACVRAGRHPSEVTLVAVSKTFPAEAVLEAYRLGLRDFGENRVQEAGEKILNLKSLVSNLQPPTSDLRWHLIGHLQSRRAREAADLFDVIQSVDSVKLADKLNRLCMEAGRVMPILLECNVSGEASKYGFPLSTAAERARWWADVEAILKMPRVCVEGLMTVAPLVADPNETRPFFRALRQLRDDLAAHFPQADWRHLSMGMTDDFEVAIEEGATMIRVGRAIFGELRRE